MKFKLPIQNAMQLQCLLNAVDTLQSSVPDLGVARFNKRWSTWTEDERKKFLIDIREVVSILRCLRSAEVTVEAEIG